ncbi:MAG: hypothetical protein GKR93_18165 [Gammaproteobacteria bacterium]|nr:hypothetical protein [Gammaproteobacteria bacterium]
MMKFLNIQTNRRCLTAALLLLFPLLCSAELKPDPMHQVLTLPDKPHPHWVWVADISAASYFPGKAYLMDADKADMLGMITMGYGLSPIALPADGSAVYTLERHYERTSRGKVTDVVGIYNGVTLQLEKEIIIPAKKISAVPYLSNVGLSDDDRFLLIYNFTPAQSISVVDMHKREFVKEISTPGCGLVLPSGNRRFLMLCSDSSILDVTFSDDLEQVTQKRGKKLFQSNDDFLTEKPVRYGDEWLFVSKSSFIYPVNVSSDKISVGDRWSLTTEKERTDNWRIGGQQHLAIHHQNGQLFALFHQGGPESHKDPGDQVWVYDVASKKKTKEIKLKNIASAIQVSQDDNPLLFSLFLVYPTLDIHDASSGEFVRSINEVGSTPMLLQTPVLK